MFCGATLGEACNQGDIMTWQFGPGVEADTQRTAHVGAAQDNLNQVATGPHRKATRSGLAGSGVLLCCVAALTLAQGRAEAASNAMTAPAALGGSLATHAPLLHLTQAPGGTFEISAIAGPSGTEIPVRISIPGDRVKPVHILLIRGLPEGFALSKAVRVDDAWAVSPQQMEKFSLLPPRGYEGSFDLQFVLVWGPERTRDIRTVPVSIGAQVTAERELIEPGVTPSSADAASPASAPSRAPAASSQTPQISPEDEKAMLERAIAILQNGDIAAARLLFQRLAEKGSARGALAMAKTYDPEVLTGMNVFGLEPDPKTAAEWYARAAEMGSEQARERLASLNARAAR